MPEDKAPPEERASLQMQIAGPEEVRVGGVGSIVAICVLGLITAFLTILLAMAKRKAAIERTKAKVAEEKLERAREDVKLKENKKERDAAAAAIGPLLKEVDQSKARISDIESDLGETKAKLAKVSSWDELFED